MGRRKLLPFFIYYKKKIMSYNQRIKEKLAIFTYPQGHQVLVDAMRLLDNELGMITDEVEDEWYLFYVKKLKESYQRQLVVSKDDVKQIDLEDSIKEIKDEQTREGR